MAVDGRVTADDTLVSNTTPKYIVLGQCMVAFAGDLGAAQVQALHWKSKECTTLKDLRTHRLKVEEEVCWYCLVYDRDSNVLATFCSDGCLVPHSEAFASLGAGELVAWGFLAATARPKTFASARLALHQALRATSQRVTSCGGRATFLTAVGRKRSVVFHTARC